MNALQPKCLSVPSLFFTFIKGKVFLWLLSLLALGSLLICTLASIAAFGSVIFVFLLLVAL